METIKIIDLLNKIINREDVPKKIKYSDKYYEFTGLNYYNVLTDEYLDEHICIEDLEQLVEIIEEEKKIPKKLKSLNNVGNVPNLVEFADKQQLNNHLLKDKLNEIIDYLKSKGE